MISYMKLIFLGWGQNSYIRRKELLLTRAKSDAVFTKKRYEKNLNWNYTRMLCAVLIGFWFLCLMAYQPM